MSYGEKRNRKEYTECWNEGVINLNLVIQWHLIKKVIFEQSIKLWKEGTILLSSGQRGRQRNNKWNPKPRGHVGNWRNSMKASVCDVYFWVYWLHLHMCLSVSMPSIHAGALKCLRVWENPHFNNIILSLNVKVYYSQFYVNCSLKIFLHENGKSNYSKLQNDSDIFVSILSSE